MLRVCRGLAEAELTAIAELQNRVVAVDGGRLKLEWATLWERPSDVVSDFLWWDGDRLLGFLGIYQYGGGTPELAGMVEPEARRRGIGTVLLDAARAELAERGTAGPLLVCPRTAAGGAQFAQARGGTLDHSEHALELRGPPTDGPTDPLITVRQATPADVDEIRHVLFEGFGHEDDRVAALVAADASEHFVVVRGDATIGYLRLTFSEGDRDTVASGGVYGFAIDPRWRGRGVGRDVLRRCCLDLIDRGAARVALEVATDNEHALGLYTSLGFEPVITEDYFRLR